MNSLYCPVCERDIIPDNLKEVESGEHEGYLYVHDDIIHTNSDVDALMNGIN